MIKKIFIFLLIAFIIKACNNDVRISNKKNLEQYDSINNLLKNYDIENASKLWHQLDSNLDKNSSDSIRWVHEQMFIQILLNASYYDSAKTKIMKTLTKIDSSKYYDIFINLKRLLSVSELQLADYNEFIKHAFEILPYYEKKHNAMRICGIKANISWAYFNLLAWENAKKFIRDAIKDAKKNNLESELPDYYQRYATIFAGQLQYDSAFRMQKFDSAILYFNKSLALLNTNKASWDLSNLFLNIGGLYTLMKMPEKAIIAYEKAIKVNMAINDEQGVANAYSNLGSTYCDMHAFSKAEEALIKAENLAIRFKDVNLIESINKNLAVLYKNTKRYKESTERYSIYIDARFGIIENKKIENSVELAKKYEKEKLEKELELSKNAELKSKNNVLALSIVILLILSLVSIISYVFSQKRKSRKIIEQIKIEHEKQLLQQQTEQNVRLRISRNLHDNLGAYASSILNKINLLENDINSKLPESELTELKMSAHQILNNLKNIVIDLNQRPLPFVEFIDQIKTELLRLFKLYPNIEFNINEHIEYNEKILPENQFHLKSIVFELINNALKHSNASNIDFEIIERNELVEIAISDNGKYSSDIENSSGHGIENIRVRLCILEGKLQIKENDLGGTLVVVQLNKRYLAK